MELLTNAWTTRINMSGGLSAVAATLTVTDPSGWPATGNFRLLIDQELLLVTGVSGLDMTVTRGVEGTTAVFHAQGALVTNILTAEALSNLIAGI